MLYRCNSKGCHKKDANYAGEEISDNEAVAPYAKNNEDVLVLRKIMHDVIAFDLHQGEERLVLSISLIKLN